MLSQQHVVSQDDSLLPPCVRLSRKLTHTLNHLAVLRITLISAIWGSNYVLPPLPGLFL